MAAAARGARRPGRGRQRHVDGGPLLRGEGVSARPRGDTAARGGLWRGLGVSAGGGSLGTAAPQRGRPGGAGGARQSGVSEVTGVRENGGPDPPLCGCGVWVCPGPGGEARAVSGRAGPPCTERSGTRGCPCKAGVPSARRTPCSTVLAPGTAWGQLARLSPPPGDVAVAWKVSLGGGGGPERPRPWCPGGWRGAGTGLGEKLRRGRRPWEE